VLCVKSEEFQIIKKSFLLIELKGVQIKTLPIFSYIIWWSSPSWIWRFSRLLSSSIIWIAVAKVVSFFFLSTAAAVAVLVMNLLAGNPAPSRPTIVFDPFSGPAPSSSLATKGRENQERENKKTKEKVKKMH
jgi:hypothetical protein